MHLNELEVKDATDIQMSAFSFDLEIDKIKNKTLRQTWWLHFSNSQIPIHR